MKIWNKNSILYKLILLCFCLNYVNNIHPQTETHIRKRLEIKNGISPKSVVASGKGLFAAQNMMYRHTVTLYDQTGNPVFKLPDNINFRKYGFSHYANEKQYGSPVEAVFTKDGKTLWVSNYQMYGSDFKNPGCDACIGVNFDPSFLYKINTETFEIENIVKVGSVPKYLAISPDEKTLIVSNWVSSDISIVDLERESQIKRVTVGPHPRGITITNDNKFAYVTVMGSTKIAEVNLQTYKVKYIKNVGKAPRSILLADSDSTLYISLNSSNQILKYNRHTKVKTYCKTAAGPRSMTLSPDEKQLYVVNYHADKFTKINTDSMCIIAEIPTGQHPIGICGNWNTSEIWVSCYSGTIEIFKDFKLEQELNPPTLFGFEIPSFALANNSFFTYVDTIVTDSILSIPFELTDSVLMDTVPSIIEVSPKTSAIVATEKTIPITIIENSIDCKYHIIIGAFSILENAETKQDEWVSNGFPAQIINGKKLNYVSVQCFVDRKSAKDKIAYISEITGDTGTPWILKK